MSSMATLARALSQAITVVTFVKILAGFFMEGNGSLVSVNGASSAEVSRISSALKNEDTVMGWIL
jgi:uncharacterized heparinase superfamily protein